MKVVALSFSTCSRGKVRRRKGRGEADFGLCPFTPLLAASGTVTADCITGIKLENVMLLRSEIVQQF